MTMFVDAEEVPRFVPVYQPVVPPMEAQLQRLNGHPLVAQPLRPSAPQMLIPQPPVVQPPEPMVMTLRIPPDVVFEVYGSMMNSLLKMGPCLSRYELSKESFLIEGDSLAALQQAKQALRADMAASGFQLAIDEEAGAQPLNPSAAQPLNPSAAQPLDPSAAQPLDSSDSDEDGFVPVYAPEGASLAPGAEGLRGQGAERPGRNGVEGLSVEGLSVEGLRPVLMPEELKALNPSAPQPLNPSAPQPPVFTPSSGFDHQPMDIQESAEKNNSEVERLREEVGLLRKENATQAALLQNKLLLDKSAQEREHGLRTRVQGLERQCGELHAANANLQLQLKMALEERDRKRAELSVVVSDAAALEAMIQDTARFVEHLKAENRFLRVQLHNARVETMNFAHAYATQQQQNQMQQTMRAQEEAESETFSLGSIKQAIEEAVSESKDLEEDDRKSRIKALRLRWHPDKNPILKDFASEVSKILNEAVSNLEKQIENDKQKQNEAEGQGTEAPMAEGMGVARSRSNSDSSGEIH